MASNDNVWSQTEQVLGWPALAALWDEHMGNATHWLHTHGINLLLALLVAVVYFVVYWLASYGVSWLGHRIWNKDDKRQAFEGLLTSLLRLTFLMLALVSMLALFPAISHYAAAVFRIYASLLLILVAWVSLHYLIRAQVRRWSLDASLELLLFNIVRIVLVLIGIYMVFAQFGVNLLPILGGLGVVGLAVGFAAQDILANFISGITLLLDRPFRIGDWIRTNNHEGQVMALTLRTTRIRTRDNEYVSIPNKELAGSVVTNLTEGGPLRMNIVVGVAYKTDIKHARQVLLSVLEKHDNVMSERAPQVWVKELNNSSVDMLMRFWLGQEYIATYPLIAMQLREEAKEALDTAGIEIPFPHVQLHIDGAKALQDWAPNLRESAGLDGLNKDIGVKR